MFTRRLRSMARKALIFETWNIGVCDIPIEKLVDPTVQPIPTWLPQPSNVFAYYADPFALTDSQIICEYLDTTTTNRGTIAVLKWDAANNTVELNGNPEAAMAPLLPVHIPLRWSELVCG